MSNHDDRIQAILDMIEQVKSGLNNKPMIHPHQDEDDEPFALDVGECLECISDIQIALDELWQNISDKE